MENASLNSPLAFVCDAPCGTFITPRSRDPAHKHAHAHTLATHTGERQTIGVLSLEKRGRSHTIDTSVSQAMA